MHEKSFSVETKSSFDHFYSTFVVATKTNCFWGKESYFNRKQRFIKII